MGDLSLFPTAYGHAATELLRRRVAAAKADDPLQPVTVVVPTNYVGVSARRLLGSQGPGAVTAGGKGVAGLNLLTVYRLAELLGAPRLAAAGRRPVSAPVVAAAVRRVLSERPGIFEAVREHPSTEEALVRCNRELSAVSAGSLEALARNGTRAGEVVRVHRAVGALLRDGWYDETDLMASAAAVVHAGTTILDDVGTVVLFLPQDLSVPAAALLRAVASRTPVEVVAGLTGHADADADVVRALARLGLQPPSAFSPAPAEPTAAISVSDAEEEVHAAIAQVVAAARAGTPLERMAVLYPAVEPYARIVAEQLDAAGVAWNGRGVRPVADRMLGRWLLDLLSLPEQRYARPAVMGLLAGAPVLDSSGRRIEAGPLQRVSRDAGIVRDRREWRVKLAAHARSQRAAADTEAATAEPREWLVAGRRRDADHADALARLVGELFDQLDEASRLHSWSQLAAWSLRIVTRYLGDERRRTGWPALERAAAERVEQALERLAGLDEVEPTTDLRVFRRTLQLELDDDLGKIGELGRGVLVGTPSAALGLDLDLVVVMGLSEGIFPTRPREDSLLPDAERAKAGDELRQRTERVGTEHRHLLAALTAAGTARIVTSPRGDLRRSVTHAPSRWLPAAGVTTMASFASRVTHVAFPATRQEYGLRALAGTASGARHRLLAEPAVAADGVLRRSVELTLGRAAERFTRFDGNIGVLAPHIRGLGDHVTSASALETWLTCPHAYFMRYVLRVQPVENPEELLEIDALEKGSLVHDVLEKWLQAMLDGPVPAPEQPWPPAARRHLLDLAERAFDDAQARGVVGHPLLWRRDRRRLALDLARFLDEDDKRRAALGATPIGAERPFGIPGTHTVPLVIDLGDGRCVRVRGRIDRVDRAGRTVVVADYKTGGTSRYDDLKPDQPLADGTKLQLAIYGLAIRASEPDAGAVCMEYWFTSAKGQFKRIGYPLTDAVVDALRGALRVVADGIAAGHFPAKPPQPSSFRLFTDCRFCDPDDLGTTDRYRDWERVRTDPALRHYVAFVEPAALTEDAR